jgi:hypothetical protein
MRAEDHHTLINYNDMDAVIDLLGQNGIYVVLDLHNWEDHDGVFGSQEWYDFWAATANHYKDNEYVVAYEIFNEPFSSTWASWIVDSGAGIQGTSRGPWIALSNCVDVIRATGDTHPIVYPPPWFWNSHTDSWHPENYKNSQYVRDNIIITQHEWYRSSESFTSRTDKLAAWHAEFPIWLGEINGWHPMDASTSSAIDIWTMNMIQWFLDRGLGFSLYLHGQSGTDEAWDIGENMLAGTTW